MTTSRLRVGLLMGTLVVGNIGAPGRLNYTVIGDTVNAAQRMGGLGKEVAADAEACVLVSETTLIAASSPDATSTGPKNVKGRSEPMNVWRLI